MLEPVEEGSEPPNKFPGEQPSIGKLRMTTKKFDEAMSNPRCITNGETPRLVELKILTLASRPPVCKSNFWRLTHRRDMSLGRLHTHTNKTAAQLSLGRVFCKLLALLLQRSVGLCRSRSQLDVERTWPSHVIRTVIQHEVVLLAHICSQHYNTVVITQKWLELLHAIAAMKALLIECHFAYSSIARLNWF